MARTFAIVPSGPATSWSVLALLLVVSLPAVVVVFAADAPLAILLVPLLAGGLVAYSGYSSRAVVFEASPEGLRIRRSLYGRFIPRDQFLPEEARIVEMKEERGLRPVLRTFGTGLEAVGLSGRSQPWARYSRHSRLEVVITITSTASTAQPP